MLAFLRMNTKALQLTSGFAAVLALGGCLATGGDKVPDRVGGNILGVDPCKIPGVTCVKVVLPPVMAGAGGIKRVAVVPGSGPGAASMATNLETRLSAVVVDDKPFYTLVKANDPSRQGTFEVSSTVWTTNDQRATQDRTKCDKKKKCTDYKVSCTVRSASVGALIRLRTKDGNDTATGEASGADKSEQCQGEDGVLAPEPVVLGKAAEKALDKLQDNLAVRTALKRVRVLDDAAGMADAGRKKRFAEAVEFAKAGRMDRACPMFDELSEVETSSVAVFYNLGFCEQVNGNWRKAYQWYSKADSNSSKPMSEMKDALDETRAYGVQKK